MPLCTKNVTFDSSDCFSQTCRVLPAGRRGGGAPIGIVGSLCIMYGNSYTDSRDNKHIESITFSGSIVVFVSGSSPPEK